MKDEARGFVLKQQDGREMLNGDNQLVFNNKIVFGLPAKAWARLLYENMNRLHWQISID